MPAPAKINTIATISRIVDMQTAWNNTGKEFPNGRVTKQRNWTTPKHFWMVEFDALTLTDYNLLRTHFNDCSGSFLTFQFDDTHTGTTYTVRYADDSLGRTPINPNVRGRYNVKVKLEQNK